MDVILLGTGAADGWPNAFCRCGSCGALRGRGELHSPTSALVDGRLLLDAGPAVEANAQRFGADLTAVTAVLVTHAHSDHLAPAFLLHRSWTDAGPLQVIGPEPVIDRCAHWLAPDQTTVELTTVSAGDRFTVEGYTVTVLPAEHHAFGEAVLYRIDDGRHRVLYATDTGPWPARTLDLLQGVPLDLVLLEETFGDRDRIDGHHDLASFAVAVRALADVGAVHARTEVVAVHLSHFNPADTLAERLGAVGAHPGRDGDVIRLGPRAAG